jgi:mRNA-degrading endonuclease RelE of RelBE toxin-antitoxin system
MSERSRYEVQLTRPAEKDLRDFRGRQGVVTAALLQLEDDPLRGHALKQSLRGARSLEFSLSGVSTAYRAVYIIIEPDRVCLVFLIGPHENIYEKAERRLRAVHRVKQ